MKKTKLLFAVAILFAALSVGFKAKAQTLHTVYLTSLSSSYPPFAASVTYYVTLVNNATNDYYYFQTSYNNLSDGVYHIGSVPAGTYTVSVAFSDYNFSQSYFDWYAGQDEGYSLNMYANTDYELTNNAVVADDYTGELDITMYRI
ncbi:MAG: carboxypeptidase-like regulatory domain-containing protein [Mucilaginibacter sp.]|uniref:carboxypeptidase-like regulatory domain-containing protein n=1 Tax=Mucilaginibacter sp. TaxID=1882438 RepID=UPI00326689C7